MYLIQVLLPLYDNDGNAFGPERFRSAGDQLTSRYGGLTVYSRAPADGLWQDEAQRAVHDELVLFEVMTEQLDRPWWAQFRRQLEESFQQDEIVIRAQQITRL